MANTIVTGIDIGAKYITAAIVEMVKQKPKILGIEHFTFDQDIFADNAAIVYQDCVKKLSKVKNMQPIFQHRVALAIPDVMVMNKVVTTDKRLPLEQQKLAAMHSFSLSFPLESDDLCFDYVQHPETIEIHAARKSVVEQRASLIKRAGMRPILIDTERQAFLQLLQITKSKCPQLRPFLVELKDRSLTVGALAEDTFFYRHIPLNTTTACSSEISRQLEQELEQLRSEKESSNINAIWFVGQKEHHDLIANISNKSFSYIGDYPLADYFDVKRSLVVKNSNLAIKACGIALRGITATEQYYAA